MAIGPTLGTGLFIGAGQALAVGGPTSLLLSYILLSLLTYTMTTSVAEVSAHMPSRHGTLVTNSYLYLSSSVAFASTYLRWYTLALFVPYETTTAMVNLGLWKPGSAVGSRLAIITAIVIGSNFLPEKTFKASERLLTWIKIGTMATLFVLTVALGLGGPDGQTAWGFKYWKHPGAMNEYLTRGIWGRVLAFFQCLLDGSVAFIFAPELIAHHAGVPPIGGGATILGSEIAGKVTSDVLQTAFPYIMSSLAMGVMAPFNETRLTNNGTGSGFSPYLIGLKDAQIGLIPTIATIAILLSSVASGRSFLYLSSNTLCAMSEFGHAPSVFFRRNRWNVPYIAVATSSVFSVLGFISVKHSSSLTKNYLLRLVTSAGFISSLVSCAVYRHFRGRLRVNQITCRHRFAVQPFATYFGMFVSTLLLLGGGLWGGVQGRVNGPRSMRFLTSYTNIGIFALLFLLHRFQDILPVVEVERPIELSRRRWADQDGSPEVRLPKSQNRRRNKLDAIPENVGAFELSLSQTAFEGA
ncbi:unnamed protein product [Penicillium salamii]|nr:unnamed protein product [Penicillium salamii]CAG8375716.1 unnamed protein product [Penicillium salamii]